MPALGKASPHLGTALANTLRPEGEIPSFAWKGGAIDPSLRQAGSPGLRQGLAESAAGPMDALPVSTLITGMENTNDKRQLCGQLVPEERGEVGGSTTAALPGPVRASDTRESRNMSPEILHSWSGL